MVQEADVGFSAIVHDLHVVLVDVSPDNFLPARENPTHFFNLPPSAVRLGTCPLGYDTLHLSPAWALLAYLIMRTVFSGITSLFGRFGDYLEDSNSNFVVVGIISLKQFEFFVCSGFDLTQCDCTFTCAVACFHTCVATDAETQQTDTY